MSAKTTRSKSPRGDLKPRKRAVGAGNPFQRGERAVTELPPWRLALERDVAANIAWMREQHELAFRAEVADYLAEELPGITDDHVNAIREGCASTLRLALLVSLNQPLHRGYDPDRLFAMPVLCGAECVHCWFDRALTTAGHLRNSNELVVGQITAVARAGQKRSHPQKNGRRHQSRGSSCA